MEFSFRFWAEIPRVKLGQYELQKLTVKLPLYAPTRAARGIEIEISLRSIIIAVTANEVY